MISLDDEVEFMTRIQHQLIMLTESDLPIIQEATSNVYYRDQVVDAIITLGRIRTTKRRLYAKALSYFAEFPITKKKLTNMFQDSYYTDSYLQSIGFLVECHIMHIIDDQFILTLASNPPSTEFPIVFFKNTFAKVIEEAQGMINMGPQYKELKKNDWELYEKVRNDIVEPDTMLAALFNDDIDLLKSIFSDPNKSYDMDIPFAFGMYDVTENTELIDAAAKYGAVKCFRHIAVNRGSTVGKNPSQTAENAVNAGSLEILRLILQDDPNTHIEIQPWIAADCWQGDIMKWLIENEMAPDEAIPEEFILAKTLKHCITSNFIDGALYMIDAGADVTENDFEITGGLTAFENACRLGRKTIAKTLMASPKVDINFASMLGFTPLHRAASHGDAPIVLMLVTSPQIDIDKLNDEGMTPLMVAASKGNTSIVRILLKHGASPNPELEEGKVNVSSLAALSGNVETFNVVVSAGAILSKRILHEAIEAGNEEIVGYLIKNTDVNVNETDDMQRTPLMIAIDSKNQKITQLLLERGADVNMRDYHGKTPLHYAARCGNIAAINDLIENGANINSKDIRGKTPLYDAADLGETNAVQKLCDTDGVLFDAESNGFRLLSIRNLKRDIKKILKKYCE